MAMAGSFGGEDEVRQLTAQLGKTSKEGERIIAPSRRPDGTLRKGIRIRPGYVPPDEVVIYQSKGARLKKEMALEVPPGYDPAMDAVKPKSKSARRNERKKDKRPQVGLDKDKNLEEIEVSSVEDTSHGIESAKAVASQMNDLTISADSSMVNPPLNSTECSTPEDPVPDIDKKIRALKKKIRLTEAQLQKTDEKEMKQEQLNKVAKLEDWRKELKLLEDKKGELLAS